MRRAVGGAQKGSHISQPNCLKRPGSGKPESDELRSVDQYVENLLHGSLLDNIARALATHDYATVIQYVGNPGVHYFGRKNTSRASINADIVQDSRNYKSNNVALVSRGSLIVIMFFPLCPQTVGIVPPSITASSDG